jgi:hypothetical protein
MLDHVNWRCEKKTIPRILQDICFGKISICRAFCLLQKKIKTQQNTLGIENQFKEYMLLVVLERKKKKSFW